MKRSLPWILGSLLLAGAAQAQSDQAQLVRPLGAADLNSNLSRLAANPRDVDALIGAGEAALALDDPRAAAGFFARADAIQSGNGRIKAGLARVMLKLQNAPEALRLFDQAGRLGYLDTTILSDRGLARDMTGDQAGAQRDYQAALQKTPDDAEIIRRYAASLGISGQVEASDKVLQPLLYKSDRTAWRYRAFILAMNNRQGDAQKIAAQTMPAQLATAIVPYLRKMPYLTAPQKAAALHFGQFPAQVGTSIAAISPTPPASGTRPAPADPIAVAADAPTKSSSARAEHSPRRSERAGRSEGTALDRTEVSKPIVAPKPVAPEPTASPPPVPKPVSAPVQPQMVQATPPAAEPAPAPVGQAAAPREIQGPPAPGFESVDAPRAAPPPAPRQPAPTLAQALTPPQPERAVEPTLPPPAASATESQPNPEATRSLADIIRAIDVPEAERRPSVAAVDLAEVAKMQAARRAERDAAADKAKKVAAAKAKAEADAKAKKEAEAKALLAANPSRNWVQIATGADEKALAFTLKRLRGKYGEIAPQTAWIAGWGRTNRLVIGPFASFTRAKTVEAKLKGQGADVFAWQSDAGEVVEKLAGQ